MAKHAMTKKELLQFLEDTAKEYRSQALVSIERNQHMNQLSRQDLVRLKINRKLIQKTIDALLVDFINIVGAYQGINFGLHTGHITSKPNDRT